MILNRKIQPDFKLIDKVNIIKAEKVNLDNQIPVYYINAGSQDLVKIDFIFEAGTWNQKKKLIASTTNNMLLEGTKTQTSLQIAEKLDYYGSYLQNDSGKHYGTLTLFILNKYLDEGLEIVEDLLQNPIFPEKDLSTLMLNRLQEFVINSQKNDKLARSYYNEMIFGNAHPYGIRYCEDDFKNVAREDLIEFFENYYNLNNCTIIISGKVEDKHFKSLNNFFGKKNYKKSIKQLDNNFFIQPFKEKIKYEERTDAFQTAIRIGKPTINMKHPDFNALQVVNTILGGYFGSRLMKNIREEKGYTYGIGSGLSTMKESGYFVVVTEVKKEVKDAALNEIYKEIEILQNEKVTDDELNVVKNYMMGDILRGFDGAFSLSGVFRNLWEYNLDYDYITNMINIVKNITSDEIQRLANVYLQRNSMYEVAVG